MAGQKRQAGAITQSGRRSFRIAKTSLRRAASNGLFWSIAVALVFGVALAVTAQWVLRRFIATSGAVAAPLDITKLSLTVVAGVGGVVALVVAYRRQRDLEQGRFVERFGAAAGQLGATDVAVRIAGVYAMAGVADESSGLRRQQCIDVLCGYLRLPYLPELGRNHQSKLVIKQHRATADGTSADDQERHLEYRHNDREVRATIIRVITDHLRFEAEYSWSINAFDFRAAYLEEADFSETTFSGTTRFDGATFPGNAGFDGARFSGSTRFDGATFSGNAGFDGANFFRTAKFGNATFVGPTNFGKATFYGTANFDNSTFSGDARFFAVTFSGAGRFNSAKFSGTANFDGATFSGNATFSGVTFDGDVNFGRVTISKIAGFGEARFSGTADFRNATFSGSTNFGSATFSGPADFRTATFARPAGFDRAKFSETGSFVRTAFYEGAKFQGADFGAKAISFAQPLLWGPPAPMFDWDQDIGQKPVNVEPQAWPPQPIRSAR
ncbi:pentapeptide repeat-containing protein [Nocardia sp. SYP-A9097]|uniref:pentapeptide repeat-containing protein n=1 Tax=Nocardia sp. SYP-A9097 TaxID=2663237 RepID=UPI001890C573|nr:pentapeptide repeat-containing protein [Nocardia sp. SYP-A9097]